YRRWSAKSTNTTSGPVSVVVPVQGRPPYSWTRLRTFHGAGSTASSRPSGCRRTRVRRPPSPGRGSVHHTSPPTKSANSAPPPYSRIRTVSPTPSGRPQEPVEDPDPEVQRLDGDALVHSVEQRLVVEALGQLQRGETVAGDAQPGELLGVRPARHAVRHDMSLGGELPDRGAHGGERGRVHRRLEGDLPVHELPVDVRPGEVVDGGAELVLGAREIAAVDLCHGGARDHVDLVTGVQHRRVGAVADGGLDQLRGRAQLLQERVD